MASIQGVYLALFGRPADPAGLSYFNDVTHSGADLTAIGDLSSTAEYQHRFAGMGTRDIIDTIYLSLFNRHVDDQGLAFYSGEIQSGRYTINSIAIHILDGAQGDDLIVLKHKLEGASLFTSLLDEAREIQAYSGDTAAEIGRHFIHDITGTDEGTKEEAQAAINQFLPVTPSSGGAPAGGGGGAPALPVFSSGTTATIKENVATTVVIHDANATSTNGAVTFSLGGTDAAKFGIDASTGMIHFLASPNFEAPTDAGANNVYDLILTATDTAHLAQSQALTVTVTDDTSIRQVSADGAYTTISADGRYVSFYSSSSLVSADTNGLPDIYFKDLQTGEIKLVSVSLTGSAGDATSSGSFISADGHFVVFTSSAGNLVAGDTNMANDVFVRDIVAGTTERVNVTSAGTQSVYNGLVMSPTIAADNKHVYFTSYQNDLVAPDANNTGADVFVHDMTSGATTLIDVSSSNIQGSNSSFSGISASSDGHFVVFSSHASNLVPGDGNNRDDIFLRDTILGTTQRISVSPSLTDGDERSETPSITADGTKIAFTSYASNLVTGDSNGKGDIFVYNVTLGTTERVSVSSTGLQADGNSQAASLSADGRYVAFSSDASNLVAGDTNGSYDVFVRDLVHGTTTRVNVIESGAQSMLYSNSYVSMSSDGRYVAFHSNFDLTGDGHSMGTASFVADGLAQGWWTA